MDDCYRNILLSVLVLVALVSGGGRLLQVSAAEEDIGAATSGDAPLVESSNVATGVSATNDTNEEVSTTESAGAATDVSVSNTG